VTPPYFEEISMSDIAARGYAHPEALVSTEWVADHLSDSSIRLVESNEDVLLYPSGHMTGAVQVDWTADLNDQLRRDYISRKGFETLMSRIGVTPKTTVVFYGDKNNWWACYAFWVFQLFGHTNARVMDGGRVKWMKEGRPMTREVPAYPATRYRAPEVLAHVKAKGQLVDVRSPEEYAGTRMHMPDYPNEGALRGGHIPGARSIPWGRAINAADGTFKDAAELTDLYVKSNKLKKDKPTIAYCRIGERSSHSWFALKYLIGFKNVKNYDGSWTEWGNSVGVPIEK
jgi:thiosulfate/3-mercaptopyruvate sulfurtransferase